MTIGLDIGGTNIKGVLLRKNEVIAKIKIKTKSKSNKKNLIAQIFKSIETLIKGRKEIKGIGIGAPSPIDFKNQKILNPPNVPALRNLYLGKIIKDKFKIKTIIDNDVHCLVLAEAILGAGKNKKMVVGLGLGTGVGGGIVLNKKLIRGQEGTGGEFGHTTIEMGGRQCNCGRKGCLEAYINEKGIRKTAKEIFGREIDSITLQEMAKRGGKKAIKAWEITGKYLGVGLANLVDSLNPDIIIVGGGIARAGELLLSPARKEMKKNILSPLAKDTPVVRAKLDERAGAIGAGLLTQ
jgi:glucokinase